MSDEGFPARLWAMADLFTPMAVRVAATLRLADHVAAGADAVPALAERTGADPDALGRLVDHLVAVGVLERRGTGALALTELGDQLRAEHPGDGRAWLDIEGPVGRAELAALRLLDAVRTGAPSYATIHGRGFWEDLASRPALAESFDALMASRLRPEVAGLVSGYDWAALSHVVDVGGGDGTLLAAILAAHPGVWGTLVELAGAAAAAGRTLADAGLADRCEIVAGSFFEPLPAGGDAYLLSGVLHDWDDARALEILRRCADAAGAAGAVLVIEEGLLADGAGAALRTEMNLRMLAYTGGRERTLVELERLAGHAGLTVAALHRATRYRSIVELRALASRASRASSRAVFDRVAASYDRHRSTYPAELIDRACAIAGLESGAEVLEHARVLGNGSPSTPLTARAASSTSCGACPASASSSLSRNYHEDRPIQMKLPPTAHTERPWRIHELAADFRLEDVWALPTPGARTDFPLLVEGIATGDPAAGSPAVSRALWALRWKLGELFGWDEPGSGLGARVATLRERLPRDLREGPSGPDFEKLPFVPLYMTEDEWAAEIANRTVHGVMHIGWVRDERDVEVYRGQMAVLVKPNGVVGEVYMAAIKPFRYLLVYPQMLRRIERDWRAGMRVAQAVRRQAADGDSR